MADARAMEKLSQRPQLAAYDAEPEPTMVPESARVERVVGAGRAGAGKRRGKKAAAVAVEEPHMDNEAEAEGVAFARHLKKLKGKKFFDAFHKGIMSGGAMEMEEKEESSSEEEMEGGALPPMPIVPPGGVRARARGNPPQAPPSFEKNNVLLDVAAREEADVPAAGAGMCGSGKSKSASRSARGQMIAKLMREEGLTLPQASKKLKAMKA